MTINLPDLDILNVFIFLFNLVLMLFVFIIINQFKFKSSKDGIEISTDDNDQPTKNPPV